MKAQYAQKPPAPHEPPTGTCSEKSSLRVSECGMRGWQLLDLVRQDTTTPPLRRRQSVIVLRGQGSAALAAARCHDGATGAGAHTSTEAVNACTATIVRLERPLALSHGEHS